MGVVDMAPPSGGKGKKKKRRLGIIIDMTPMVDIAFLLLIFYMVTTIFAEPQAMEINLPPTEENIPVKMSKVLTLRVDEYSDMWYAHGTDEGDDNPDPVPLKYGELYDLLVTKNQDVSGLITLIKIHKKAKYENMIEILDNVEVVEFNLKETQRIWKEEGKLPPDTKEFSYRFSLAPWTRLDQKTITTTREKLGMIPEEEVEAAAPVEAVEGGTP